MPEPTFLAELRKRRVVQTAAIYGAVAWGVTEVVVTIVQQLFLPQWVSTLAVIGFVVGFPVAMFLAWTFDFTAEGIRRTTVTSRRGTASIALSLGLLVAGTAGVFFLIRPGLEERGSDTRAILPNSVAVLPFDNASRNPDDTYLSAGLSDELRDQLGRVAGLRIAARSSSIAVRELGTDAMANSERLGVASLVEGSLRRQGNLLHVSVQLIDGATGLALWSDSFERGPGELLRIQQEIAEAVVRHVLPGSDVAAPATRNPTANELMLLARYHEQQVRERQEVDEGELLEAIRLYREATEADPESALAFSRLAGALIYLGDLDAAEAPIFRALEINPGLSEVQHTLGLFHWAGGRVKEAGADWARAVELDPNNPDALTNYAIWRWYNIEIEGVKEMFRRAHELDPLNLERYGTLGSFLALEDHPAEARDVVRQVEELFEGAPACRVIAEILDHLGDVDRAIAWTIRARDLEPDNLSHVEKLAEYYVDIGDFQTATTLDSRPGVGLLFKMRRFEDVIDTGSLLMIDQPTDIQIRALLATAHNALGQFDSAVYVLKDTGLPESLFKGWRSTAEWDGLMALMNALYGRGETELARGLAQRAVDLGSTVNYDWWVNLEEACQRAILGQDDEVHDSLQRTQKGMRIVWDPMLVDVPCFDRFADDPDYQATILHFDERRALLRARLPTTLAEFGVSL